MQPVDDNDNDNVNSDNIVVPLPDVNVNGTPDKLSADATDAEPNYLNAPVTVSAVTVAPVGDAEADAHAEAENTINNIVEDATAGVVVSTTVPEVPDGNGIAHEAHEVDHLAHHDVDPIGNGDDGDSGEVQHHGVVPEQPAGTDLVVEEAHEEEERDLVHEIVEEERNGAPHDSRKHHSACLIGFIRKPANLMQASDTLELGRLSNAQCKVMLSVMNVTGCKNSNLAAKKYILACKMVQRQVTLQSLFDITSRLHLVQPQEQRADGGTPEAEVTRIKSLPKTSASADPVRPGQGMVELVNWARGDVPIFINSEVVIGEPSLDATATLLQTSGTIGVDGTVTVSPITVPNANTVGATGGGPDENGAVGGVGNELKRRLSRTPRGADEAKRRRRISSSSAGATTVGATEAELHIKEAEAQSASARAVSDTLKAIKESESMMAACEINGDTRVFYKEVIATLRQKMASILGMQLQR